MLAELALRLGERKSQTHDRRPGWEGPKGPGAQGSVGGSLGKPLRAQAIRLVVTEVGRSAYFIITG